MRKTFFLLLAFLFLPAGASAQFPTVGKDIAFAQIAAGGPWETVLNLTNRGTTTYTGTLNLFRSSDQGAGDPWSPIVNGNPISGGKLNVSLRSGETVTLRITGSGSTESGFGTIKPTNLDETSFIEGTLTYSVKSGTAVLDSIGILPSNGNYLTTIPFESFSALAFALANAETVPAAVQLKLFSPSNQLVSTLSPALQLQPNQQVAKYGWQLFPNVQMTGGRLEVQSDVPILGTALTDAGGQFSSLPFTPAVKAYSLTLDIGGVHIVASLNIRVNGAVAEVRALSLTHNGQPVYGDPTYVAGTLIGNSLDIHIHTLDDSDKPVFQCITVSPFSFSASRLTGTIRMWSLDPPSYVGTGPVSLTAIN